MKQNSISFLRNKGIDLGSRWNSVLNLILNELNFTPNIDSIRKIGWWKTGKIGSISIKGAFTDKDGSRSAVLKIQGTKLTTSEYEMIEMFRKYNKSSKIRPPRIYAHLEWNPEKNFEAIVYEDLEEGELVIKARPTSTTELDEYFQVYEEYRQNCRSKSWLDKPEKLDYRGHYKSWKSAVQKMFRADKYFDKNDKKLAEKAILILENESDKLEFVHGHFQPGDIHKLGKEYVLTSNIFWGWRIPFYDIVFGYHWWMLGMEHVDGLTSEILQSEREKWIDKIYSLKEVKNNSENIKRVNLALLERAIPALMVDRFMMNQDRFQAKIITESTRDELRRLIHINS